MTNKHAYTVCGHYPFPSDMLRYDEAKPLSSKDQAIIDYLASASDENSGLQEVHLICEGKPDVARWNSFGWSVTSVKKVVKALPAPLREFLKQELLRRVALERAASESEAKAA